MNNNSSNSSTDNFDPRTEEEYKKYPFTYIWNRETLRYNILNMHNRPCVDRHKVPMQFEEREQAAIVCHGMNVDNAIALGYKITVVK